MSEFEPTPEDHPTAIAYAAGFRAGQAALSAPPTVQPSDDDAIELSEELQKLRALDIVAQVRALGAGFEKGDGMPTPVSAGWESACEEIEHRLQNQEWELTTEGGWRPVDQSIARPAASPQAEAPVPPKSEQALQRMNDIDKQLGEEP